MKTTLASGLLMLTALLYGSEIFRIEFKDGQIHTNGGKAVIRNSPSIENTVGNGTFLTKITSEKQGRGGLQLQPTLIDQETLKKAYETPDAYPELIVRIGGYSEYYNRLSRELQFEVLKRTEHMI